MAGGGVKKIFNTIRGGADGATYIPFVSEDGYLSWTNNKGYPNPPPVKIKYELTEADKRDIANMVVSMLKS